MPFPSNTQFVPILVNGQPVFDNLNDESPVSTDIVGNSTFPAGYFAYDGTNIYFRIRLNGDPRNSGLTAFRNFAWGVLINTSGQAGVYDWLFNVDGNNNRVSLIQNTVKLVNSWNDPAEGTGGGTPNFSRTIASFDIARATVADSTFGGNADYFIDWFLPAATVFSYLGINENSPIRAIFFTSANSNNYNKDSLRTNEGFSFADALSNPTTPAAGDVRAKLSIVKEFITGPTSVLIGQQTTWGKRITVTNTGRSQATSVNVRDVLSVDTISNLSFTSTSLGTATYNSGTKTISWNLGNLAAGATAILNYTVTGLFSTAGTRTFNTATVTGFDSFTGNALPATSDTDTIIVVASGSISGTVVNGGNGLTVPGATVSLYQGATLIATTVSNANGLYSFSNLAPGSYTIQANQTNFNPYTANVTVTSGSSTTQNILLSPQYGLVIGTVTDTGGTLLNAAQVNLSNSSGVILQQVSTNASGQYAFTNVLPGNYTVSVSVPNYQSQTAGVIANANQTSTVNFALQASPGSVVGTVFAPGGTGIPSAAVQILNQGGGVVASTTTDGTGSFTLPGLTPGFYTIRATASGFGANQTGVSVLANQVTSTSITLTPNPGQITGTITDGDTGALLGGVTIKFVSSVGIVVGTAVSDAFGVYTSPDLPPDAYTLTFLRGGYGSETLGAIVNSNQTTVANVTMTKLSGSITGSVQDTSGNPIQGGTITLYKNNVPIATTATDEFGNYTISGISPGSYTVFATANSFASTSTGAVVESEQTSQVNFSLSPNPGFLTGNVSDINSIPIQGAAVTIRQGTGSGSVVATVVTDENGNYFVTSLLPGNYTVTVNAPEYQNAANGVSIVSNATTTANFTLQLNPGIINGTITNAQTGGAISGANIEIRILDGNGITVASVFSDSNGYYQTPTLAPETYSILVVAPNFQVNGTTVTVPPGGAVSANISLLPNPGIVQGTITDPNGQPISGASINLLDPSGALIQSSLTDSQGFYLINSVPPGSYTLTVLAENFQSTNTGVDVLANNTTVTNLSLQPNPGSISGTVSPLVQNTIVQLYTSTNVFIGSTLPDAFGVFQFANLAPGSYIVTSFAPNYTTVASGANVLPNLNTNVSLTLQPNPATIAGNIENSSGQPLNNATIVVTDRNETILGTAFSNANGNFSIGNLPTGSVSVTVFAPNYGTSFTGAILSPGETAVVNFTLVPEPGSINGTVTNSITGSPIEGVQLAIRQSASGGLIGSFVTDQFGNFQVNNLPPGSYTITASAQNFGSNQIGVIVVSNESTIASLSLSPVNGSISGTLVDEFGNPITTVDTQIRLFTSNNILVAATLANSSDGSFVFENLTPGNYIISASAPNYTTNSLPLIVASNETTVVNVPLTGLPATVQGQVLSSASGQGISGATVTLKNANNVIILTTTTDSTGQFVASNLPSGSLIISADAPDFGTASLAVFVGPGETAGTTLQLSPDPGNISGIISNLQTGEALSGASISLRDSTAAVVATVTSNAFGEFQFNGVSQGSYTLIANALNFSTTLLGVRVISNNTSVASLTLEPNPGYIQGFVTDASTGNPVVAADMLIRTGSPSGPIIYTTTTNQSGFFQSNGLLPGTYYVTVSSPEYGNAIQSATVSSNQSTQSSFTLNQIPATVQGLVTDTSTGLPINALIRLSDQTGNIIQRSQTDINGFYRIEGFNAGIYNIVATSEGYETETKSFSVGANQVATIDFSMTLSNVALTGSVLDTETLVPIPGAIVEVYPIGSSTLAQRTLSDSTGGYSILGLPPGNYRTTSYTSNYQTNTVDVTLPPANVTNLTILLQGNPATVNGTITDAQTGATLSGVSVQIVKSGSEQIVQSSLTDQNGNYQIQNLPQGSYTVVASLSNYTTALTGVNLTPGEIELVELSLQPFPGSISGYITNSLNSAPIPGALVQAFDSSSTTLIGSAITDSNGGYVLSGLPQGAISVVASASSFGTNSTLTNLSAGEQETISLSLTPNPGTILGTITNQLTGSPIEAATVSVFVAGTGTLVQSSITDSSGYYTVLGLSPGQYDVIISQTDFGSKVVAATVNAGTVTTVNSTLAPNPATIVGSVSDDVTGVPLEGAVVQVFVSGSSTPVQSVLVDQFGNFYITDLNPGSYTVNISNPNFQTYTTQITLGPGELIGVSASLSPNPASITGVIFSGLSALPIPGAEIRLVLVGSDISVASTIADENGQYFLSGLQEGAYILVVNANNFATHVEPVTLVAGDTKTINATLEPIPAQVSGFVTDSVSGLPIQGATVQAYQNNVFLKNVFTNDAGEYILDQLPAGTIDLIATHPNYAAQNQTLFLDAGSINTAAFTLSPNPGTVLGNVVDGDSGLPLVGAQIQVFDNAGNIVANSITNNSGNYELNNLPPGTFNINISADNFTTQISVVTLSPNETIIVNASLSPTPANVFGNVIDADSGSPISGALVEAFIGGTTFPIQSVLTDANGNYSLNNLPARSVRISVSAPSYSSEIFRVILDPGEVRNVNATLQSNPATVRGSITVSQTGAPIPNATVQIIVSQTGIIFATVSADENGFYAFDNIKSGNYSAVFLADGFISESISFDVQPGEIIEINAALGTNPATITGNVTNSETGEGIPLAILQIYDELTLELISNTLTESDGSYRFTGLPPGRFRVLASAREFQRSFSTISLTSGEVAVLDFELQPNPANLSGVVRSADTGLPISNALVKVYISGTDFLLFSTLSGANGSYEFITVPSGSFRIETSADSYITAIDEILLVAGETKVLNQNLQSTPSGIFGVVTDVTTGNPIPGVLVQVAFEGSDIFITNALTDQTGNYTISGLSAGNYKIIFSTSGYALATATLSLQQGETKQINEALTPFPATLTGNVYNEDTGEPLIGAVVQVFDLNGGFLVSTITDQDGNYSIPNLAPGTVNVNFTALQFSSSSTSVTLKANETVILNGYLLPNPGSLFGIVSSSQSGLPLEGALVQVFIAGTTVLLASTLTDSSGTYTISNLPSRALRVVVSKENYSFEVFIFFLAPGEVKDLPAQLNPDPATISGTVTAASTGNGIQNAQVTLVLAQTGIIFAFTSTDENGNYSLSGIPPGLYNILFAAESYASSTFALSIEPGDQLIQDAALQQNPAQIIGTVSSLDTGSPLSGALIQVYDELSLLLYASTLSLEDGTYVVPGLPQGRFRIIVSLSGFQREIQVSNLVAGETKIVNFALASNPVTLVGTVKNSDNLAPIENALVKVFLAGTDILLVTALTDTSGSFEFITLPAGGLRVETTADNYSTDIERINVVAGETKTLNILLSQNLAEVLGTVTDSTTGLTLPGVLVQIVLQGSTVIVANMITNQDGFYDVPGLAPGTYVLTFGLENYATATATVNLLPNEILTLNVSLSPNPARLLGTVTASGSQIPLEGAFVQIFNENGNLLASTFTDSLGQYSISNLPPERITATFSKENYASVTSAVILAPNETKILNAELSSFPARISGIVTNGNTTLPFNGALVQVFIAGSTVPIASALTDSSGFYSFPNLSSQTVRIAFSATGFATQVFRESLAPGEEKIINVTLLANPSTLSGTVTNAESGAPIATAEVFLVILISGIIYASTTTDENGYYNFSNIQPDNYNVVFTENGYERQTVPLDVEPDSVYEVDAALRPISASITGTVTYAESADVISGAVIRVYDEANITLIASTITLIDGTYLITGLPSGRYNVTAVFQGLQRGLKLITLDADETEIVDFALENNPAKVFGIISSVDTTAPISEALVRLFIAGTDIIVASTLSNQDGEYKFTNSPPGTYRMTVSAQTYVSYVSEFTLSTGEELQMDVALQAFPAGINGRVTQNSPSVAQALIPLAGVLVQVVYTDTSVIVRNTLTDTDGTYSIETLPAGNYTVIFALPGFASYTVEANLGRGEIRTIDVTLLPNESALIGFVTEEDTGDVFPGVIVQVFLPLTESITSGNIDSVAMIDPNPTNSFAVPLIHTDATLVASTLTDINGFYEFLSLPINVPLEVVFSSAEYAPVTITVTIPPNTVVERDIALLAIPNQPCIFGNIVSVNGYFVNEQGQPITTNEITIQTSSVRVQQATQQVNYTLTVSGLLILEVVTTAGVCVTPPIPFSQQFVYTVVTDSLTTVRFINIGGLTCQAEILCATDGEFIAADVIINFTVSAAFESIIEFRNLPPSICIDEPMTIVEYLQLIKAIQDSAQRNLNPQTLNYTREVNIVFTQQEDIHLLLQPPNITFTCFLR